jgi:tetratricopeptide (TPR) repeat protein
LKKKYLFILLSILIPAAAIVLIFLFSKNNIDPDIPSLLPRIDSNNSAEYKEAYKSVEYYKDQIKKHPNNAKNYVELSQIFIQEARVTGKHHEYIPAARTLIETALNKDRRNFDAKVTKASILMTMHQFLDAKKEIGDAIEINPYSSSAFDVLVDALVELGHYNEAVQACDRLLRMRPDLRSYARASYLRELFGQEEASIQAMTMAANSGQNGQENRAWTLYNLGNLLLNEGRLDSAEYVFKGILEERPYYDFALCGLADVSASRQNYSQAIEYYVKAAQITSNHIITEKLADIYKKMGLADNEKEMNIKVLDSFTQHEKDGYDIDLEYARYCSTHNINLDQALERIKREYVRRPENIDVLDAYAWTLYKMGKQKEAEPLMQNAMRLHTNRPIFNEHAGLILR